MEDNLASIFTTLAFLSFCGAVIALFRPGIARTSSRRSAFGRYFGAFVVLVFIGSELTTDLGSGVTALRTGDYDYAIERLSRIPSGDENYDSALVLLRRAREGKAAAALRAQEQANPRLAEAHSFALGVAAFGEGDMHRAFARLSEVSAGHENYDSAQALRAKAGKALMEQQRRDCPECENSGTWGQSPLAPSAEVVSTRLVSFTTASGAAAQMVLINWRNTGKAPIRTVYADIVPLDDDGNVLESGAPDYTIFATEDAKDAVPPGVVYDEPDGEGFVLLPSYGRAERVRARITRVK